jgi:Glycerol-3-phosphate dehydrogenase
MAQDALDHLARRWKQPITHPTESLTLDGAEGHAACQDALRQAAARFGWGQDVLARLAQYGGQAKAILALCAGDGALAQRIVPDLPYIMAEVLYACHHEMAVTLEDVLARRLHIQTEDWSQGVEPAPAVARLMAGALGWSAHETMRQVERYHEQL